MASVSQFAAPRDGEASFWFAYDTTPLGLTGAHEEGDSFAVRSPQGRRGLILLGLRMTPLLWASRSRRMWSRFRSSQPPGTWSPLSGLHLTPPRLASQDATLRDGEA